MPSIAATLSLHPETVTLKGGGKWITAYIELSEALDPDAIGLDTLRLNGEIQAVTDPKYAFVSDPTVYLTDHDANGIVERLVKFSKKALVPILEPGVNMVTLSGEFFSVAFSSTDDILLN